MIKRQKLWNILRQVECAQTWWFPILDPWQDEIETPSVEVNDVLVRSFLVLDVEDALAVVDGSGVHGDGFPIDVELETVFKYHGKRGF